jgi:hypothetical protein
MSVELQGLIHDNLIMELAEGAICGRIGEVWAGLTEASLERVVSAIRAGLAFGLLFIGLKSFLTFSTHV